MAEDFKCTNLLHLFPVNRQQTPCCKSSHTKQNTIQLLIPIFSQIKNISVPVKTVLAIAKFNVTVLLIIRDIRQALRSNSQTW